LLHEPAPAHARAFGGCTEIPVWRLLWLARMQLHAFSGLALAATLAALTPQKACNRHLMPAGHVQLPGRGLALTWSPDGDEIAAGGHFKDPTSSLRYDLRIVDVAGLRLSKSFACHYWWVVAADWVHNPFVGEVIAEGGGDHAVKLWHADGTGSTECKSRGQFREDEGALKALYEISGWTTSLDFSPDGRFLAGSSRDGAVRIWQVEPGPNQWKVVRLWYEKASGNLASVRWAPDGTRLVTGDRKGRVIEWSFDRLWDDATIDLFATLDFSVQERWFAANPTLIAGTKVWLEGGHKEVWNVRYSPDGTRIAATGTDGVLSVYEAGTGTVVHRLQAPETPSPFYGLDWHPDGRFLAAGTKAHDIHVYDAETGAYLDTLVGHRDLVTAVAWSPDGELLASTAGGPLVNLELNEMVEGPDTTVRFWTWRAAPPAI